MKYRMAIWISGWPLGLLLDSLRGSALARGRRAHAPSPLITTGHILPTNPAIGVQAMARCWQGTDAGSALACTIILVEENLQARDAPYPSRVVVGVVVDVS